MYKQQLRYAALVAFVIALISTGIGGWSNMTGTSFRITEQHAWNDGLFMMLVAIFLVLVSMA